MYDVLIIGAGPAGISAALYVKRANKTVKVLYHGVSQLEKAHKIDNFYGFPNGISGEQLYNDGISQARNLGVEVEEKEVFDIVYNADKTFTVKTEDEELSSKAVIISTGNKKIRPNIEGVEQFEGRGISYCAICDGFFYRKKNVAIIGNGSYALSEAKDLENIVNSITVFTNGLPAPETDYKVVTEKISRINGETRVNNIELENGEQIAVDGIFIALGTAGGADFAKKIGVSVKGDSLKVNEKMETNLKGLFACGNVTGGLLQVCKATYEGAVAGLSAVEYIKSINN
ncbi:MAG: NAD(P)/FAD-dependent oxidoreductase [Ruminococcaceae bacterium]|jgi:thioredoxin reductase (NADPH)|nr:NAD(P)/FAD-dependent oxidoreductase [Oscillospiraceae bacterium]